MAGPLLKSGFVGSNREALDDTFVSLGAASAAVITRLLVVRDQGTRPLLDRSA